MMARLACIALLGAGLLGVSPGARAAPSPDASAAAEALFEEGVALGEAGRWRQACEKFAASQQLDVAVGTLLRLGDCYERIGKLASAWAHFREARSLAQTQNMAERERIAAQRADALEPRLARVTLWPPTERALGLQITLGETLVPPASWGSALPVDSGALTIEARAPGYLTFRRTVSVPTSPGARITVVIPGLEPERRTSAPPPAMTRAQPKAPAPPPRLPSDRGYAARATGITFAVMGGVGLLGAGGLAALASKRNDESLDHCPNGPHLCTARGVRLREDATKLADMATVSAAVGGGLLVSGLIVYVIGASRSTKAAAALELVPDAGLTRIALNARGAF